MGTGADPRSIESLLPSREPPDYARSGFISLAGLKAKGWKPAQIRKLLGDPDTTAKNPHYSAKGAPTKLYDIARVAAAEGQLPRNLEGRIEVQSLKQEAKIIGAKRAEAAQEKERIQLLMRRVEAGELAVKEAAAESRVTAGTFRSWLNAAGISWPAKIKAKWHKDHPTPETAEIRQKTAQALADQERARRERKERRQALRLAEQKEIEERRRNGELILSKSQRRKLRKQGVPISTESERCVNIDPESPDGQCRNHRRKNYSHCRPCRQAIILLNQILGPDRNSEYAENEATKP